MFGPLSKKGLLVCSSTEDATMLTNNKQGIGSILGPDATEAPSTKVASLRRTLSADMSSKKWLSQQGFSPLKRVASSQQFPASSISDSSSSSSSEEEDYEERKELEKNRKLGKFDIWSSIISQKGEEDTSKSAPVYVHPLVKRSSATLSEKSLEICTESLGSETGSDGFSSNPPSESGDMQDDIDRKEEEKDRVEEPRVVVKHYKYDVCAKKSTHSSTSFPPPIPSLSRENVRIKTHRDNGRLVLEAISMPSKNNFVAQRQDGRLVLTFSGTNPTTTEEEEDDDDDEVEEFEKESEMEQAPPKLPIGVMNVHRLAVMMNKPIWLANRNPTWPKNLDDIVKFGENDKVEPITKTLPPPPLAQSLPPRPPRMAGRLIPSTTTKTTSSNAYEYNWRRPNNQPMASKKNLKAYNNDQQMVVLVPWSKGCKEQKRSLLFWEPYCIAT